MTDVMQRSAESCPAPETLAEFLDGGLNTARRAAIEEHLTHCHTCCEVVAETVRLKDDSPRDATAWTSSAHHASATGWAGVRAPGRSSRFAAPRLAIVGTGALVAASLALFVWVVPHRGPEAYDRLIQAVGNYRTTEGKFTGFPYGPLRSATRSASGGSPPSTVELQAATAEAQALRGETPTADNLHALGVARVIVGDYDEGIVALEQAAGSDSGNARIINDLAAAYLARALAVDSREDAARALAASERAIAADKALADAHFNRALALESLLLNSAATRAWNQYLQLEPAGGWADEARAHLAGVDVVQPPQAAPASAVPPAGEKAP